MNDVQEALARLQEKGWTIAAIADELGVHRETVSRWRSATSYPDLSRPTLMALEMLAKRQRVPKRKRYKQVPS